MIVAFLSQPKPIKIVRTNHVSTNFLKSPDGLDTSSKPMKSVSFLSSSSRPFCPLHSHHHHYSHRCSFPSALSFGRRRIVGLASRGESNGGDFGGRLVDDGIIVLRRRIHELKMAEQNDDPPSDWMGWEKRYHATYGPDVRHMVGLLQVFLMNTRPSLAIGMTAWVILSVPTLVILVLMHLMEVWRSALSGLRL